MRTYPPPPPPPKKKKKSPITLCCSETWMIESNSETIFVYWIYSLSLSIAPGMEWMKALILKRSEIGPHFHLAGHRSQVNERNLEPFQSLRFPPRAGWVNPRPQFFAPKEPIYASILRRLHEKAFCWNSTHLDFVLSFYASVLCMLPKGAGGIMFSGCLCVCLSVSPSVSTPSIMLAR